MRAPLPIVAAAALLLALPATADERFERRRAAFEAATGAGREEALEAVAKVRTAECARFLDQVRRGDADAGLRARAVRLLGVVGVDPARELLEAIFEQEAPLRADAVDGLSRLRPLVPPDRFLRALAPAEAPAVRREAAHALRLHPSVEVARAVAATLLEAELDAGLRRTALATLGGFIEAPPLDAWYVEALAAKASNPLAPAAPHLLGLAPRCAHAGVRAAVLAHRRSGLAASRAAVADVLGALDAGRGAAAADAQEALAKLLEDQDESVVLAAGAAVERVIPAGDALKVVLELCRSKAPALRAIAVGALAGVRDHPKAARAAANAVDDPAPAVRAAAIGTLRRMGTKEAIGALIAGLKANPDGRLQGDLLDALAALTGGRVGEDWAAWHRWWQQVEPTFEVPPPGEARPAPAGGSQARGVPTYYGSEVRSRRVGFVVDTSSSMRAEVKPEGTTAREPAPDAPPARTRMDVCKEELAGVVGALGDGTRLLLVTFSSRPRPWRPTSTPLDAKERAATLEHVAGLKAGGGTNLFDAIEVALQDPEVDTLYVLSDGGPTLGQFTAEEDVLREVKKRNVARRVAIHTISIGTASRLMRRLAEENGGVALVR